MEKWGENLSHADSIDLCISSAELVLTQMLNPCWNSALDACVSVQNVVLTFRLGQVE